MSFKTDLKYNLKYFFPKLSYYMLGKQKPEYKHRIRLLNIHNINLVFDVGANIGLYSHCLRNMGYDGRIVAFEPLSNEFKALQKLAGKDSSWECLNMALGNENQESEINISQNSVSSSILEMLPSHYSVVPESKYFRKEKIIIKTLDSIFKDYYTSSDKVFLKIDTQGYEKSVLEGAINSLPNISGLQLEMSIVPLYKDELLFRGMLDYIYSLGFKLISLEHGWSDPVTGNLMQIDGIFFRD